jgi:hypothetical protein
VFLGLAVLLPAAWTVAKAGDEAPAAAEGKKAKKSKKSKKAEGEAGKDKEKKAE